MQGTSTHIVTSHWQSENDHNQSLLFLHAHICAQPGHPAFTIPQLPEPLKVLAERAQELKVMTNMLTPDVYPAS